MGFVVIQLLLLGLMYRCVCLGRAEFGETPMLTRHLQVLPCTGEEDILNDLLRRILSRTLPLPPPPRYQFPHDTQLSAVVDIHRVHELTEDWHTGRPCGYMGECFLRCPYVSSVYLDRLAYTRYCDARVAADMTSVFTPVPSSLRRDTFELHRWQPHPVSTLCTHTHDLIYSCTIMFISHNVAIISRFYTFLLDGSAESMCCVPSVTLQTCIVLPGIYTGNGCLSG